MAENKVAIVTGGSRGIGAAISTRLARDGFIVALNYAGNAAEADDVVKEIKAFGGKCTAVQADITDASAVHRMFDNIESTFGGVDVLVNNAGIMKLAPLAKSDDELINSQINTNFRGSVNTLREAAARLRQGGRIINLSSSVVGLKLENYGIYAATKSAVETLTGILSKELRGRSITVNAVAPGPTATALFFDGKSPEMIDKMAKMSPLERLGTPEDIANVVAFLASSGSGWINGQTIRVNGGVI